MIGLFDSGLGGLTILRQLEQDLPQYEYLYLGDTAHAPYGSKDAAEITHLTWQGVEQLFSQGAKLVLLACNTASAVALRHIQQTELPQKYPDRNVLGIIVPTIEQITGIDWKHQTPITTTVADGAVTIGVLATTATVSSGTYEHEIHKRNPSLKIISQACPQLVPLIESQAPPEKISAAIKKYLNQLYAQAENNLYAVLLGCTHYELIADLIQDQLLPSIRLYRQPQVISQSLKSYLHRHPDLATPQSKPAPTRIMLTKKAL